MKWLKKVAATPLTTIARVVDDLNAQTNDRTNAPSIHAVREAVNNNWLSIYPIGSIYMSVNNVNPSEIFGGTWQQIKDKFLLACGDTYNNGATGGSATHTPSGTVGNHTLTAAEIPSHTHTYDKATQAASHVLTVAEIPSHTHNVPWAANVAAGAHYVKDAAASGYTAVVDILGGRMDATSNATGGGSGHTHSITSASNNTGNGTGGNGAHNHSFTGTAGDYMPPYLAVNVWVRTA
jgi:cytochrome c5